MGSEKVMNTDNSFKKVDSKIQAIRGKKINQNPGLTVDPQEMLSKLINYKWIKSV